MSTCDLCGVKCKASDTVELKDEYQIAGIVDICPRCNDWASAEKDKLISNIYKDLQKAILEKHKACHPTPMIQQAWWAKLFYTKDKNE